MLIRFLALARQGAHAAQTSSGFADGSLWADARLTFWTVTLWRDEASMRSYAYGPTHIGAMKHLHKHQDAYTEAAFASGVSSTPQPPTTPEVYAFLTARATFYELPRASSDQQAHRIRLPKIRTVRRLEPLPTGTPAL